jgi:N-acetylglucosamine-6-phosphate deacetylase
VAGAALADGLYAEVIPDLLHVHAGAIRAALRADTLQLQQVIIEGEEIEC